MAVRLAGHTAVPCNPQSTVHSPQLVGLTVLQPEFLEQFPNARFHFKSGRLAQQGTFKGVWLNAEHTELCSLSGSAAQASADARTSTHAGEAALPHRLSAAHTLAWPSRVFSFSHTVCLSSQPTPASRSRGSVAVISALLPFYASPCSAASRWWRIALAPGFVKPLCRIASLPHTRSPGPRGFSLSLSNTEWALEEEQQ